MSFPAAVCFVTVFYYLEKKKTIKPAMSHGGNFTLPPYNIHISIRPFIDFLTSNVVTQT